MFQLQRSSGQSIIAALLTLALCAVMLITSVVAQEAPRDSGVLIKPPTVASPMPRAQSGTSAKVGSTRRRRRRARRTRSRAALRRAAAIRAAPKPRAVQRVIAKDSTPNGAPATPRRPKMPVSGGVLNGRALVLPLPVYPPVARAANAAGTVEVRVLIDENGKITEAEAISGPPLLRKAAEDAAMNARFAPTQLSGQPVSVTGVINYEFVVPQ